MPFPHQLLPPPACILTTLRRMKFCKVFSISEEPSRLGGGACHDFSVRGWCRQEHGEAGKEALSEEPVEGRGGLHPDPLSLPPLPWGVSGPVLTGTLIL